VNMYTRKPRLSVRQRKVSKMPLKPHWFEVVETRGHIVDGKVGHYQVALKIGFRLD